MTAMWNAEHFDLKNLQTIFDGCVVWFINPAFLYENNTQTSRRGEGKKLAHHDIDGKNGGTSSRK